MPQLENADQHWVQERPVRALSGIRIPSRVEDHAFSDMTQIFQPIHFLFFLKKIFCFVKCVRTPQIPTTVGEEEEEE